MDVAAITSIVGSDGKHHSIKLFGVSYQGWRQKDYAEGRVGMALAACGHSWWPQYVPVKDTSTSVSASGA